jgi:hypothetical protein
LRDGTYRLRRMLDINAPGVMLRSASGDRDLVVIRGEGPTEGKVGVAVSISASNVTIADLTIGNVGFHGVQVRGEKSATGTVLHEIHIVDTGQQLLKGSIGDDRSIKYGGLISCSLFEYLDHAPSDYTNGVDILGGTGWVVRKNRFERIRGKPESGYVCGPTVLFWQGGSNAQVLDNVLVDCYRGIALGLVNQPQAGGGDPRKYQDHSGGVIRGNEWRLRNDLRSGGPAVRFLYGDVGDRFVCGDWDGNGSETPGVVRGNQWLVRNSNRAGPPVAIFRFGAAGQRPVVGDWNGDGTDTVGTVDGNVWRVRNRNSTGPPFATFTFGHPNDTPVVGDWDGNGRSDPAMVRASTWRLRRTLTSGSPDQEIRFGQAVPPLAGRWIGLANDLPARNTNGNVNLRRYAPLF